MCKLYKFFETLIGSEIRIGGLILSFLNPIPRISDTFVAAILQIFVISWSTKKISYQ